LRAHAGSKEKEIIDSNPFSDAYDEIKYLILAETGDDFGITG
jgi:hypothetical protein